MLLALPGMKFLALGDPCAPNWLTPAFRKRANKRELAMTLRKALCKGLVTEEMLRCWAEAHNTTPKSIKRRDTVSRIVVFMLIASMFFIFGSMVLMMSNPPSLWGQMPFFLGIVGFVGLIPGIVYAMFFDGKSDFMSDVEKMYTKLVRDGHAGVMYHESCSIWSLEDLPGVVERFLSRLAREIVYNEKIMKNPASTCDLIEGAAFSRRSFKNEFDEWHGFIQQFGLVEDRSSYHK